MSLETFQCAVLELEVASMQNVLQVMCGISKITALCPLVASTLKEVVQWDKKGGWTGLKKYNKH